MCLKEGVIKDNFKLVKSLHFLFLKLYSFLILLVVSVHFGIGPLADSTCLSSWWCRSHFGLEAEFPSPDSCHYFVSPP